MRAPESWEGTQAEWDDYLIDHRKMLQRYLVWHDTKAGPRFTPESFHSPHLAEREAELWREDGYWARVMKVTVVDGHPVAEWIEETR